MTNLFFIINYSSLREGVMKASENTKYMTAKDARIALHGRILRCPLGGNPTDCQFYELRKKPLEERLTWLIRQSDEEVVETYNSHIRCFKKKLQKMNLPNLDHFPNRFAHL